jgi:tRNA pseudouridine38-40 synthase
MRNFKATLGYDGTAFHGWQTQPGLRTVQQTLEEALQCLTGEERVRVNASGRTDTGVHAIGQVLNFLSPTRIPIDRLRGAINAHLPEDVQVRAIEEVPLDFDANRDAVRKLYRYVLHDGDVPDLFWRRFCWHLRTRLDLSAMQQALEVLRGTHDFRCFETEWPNRASSVRTILHLALNRFGDWLWLDVEADGFLYNMVRAIAGSLVDVGRGFRPSTWLGEVLQAGDRTQAGPTAPPQGLFLVRVTYPS